MLECFLKLSARKVDLEFREKVAEHQPFVDAAIEANFTSACLRVSGSIFIQLWIKDPGLSGIERGLEHRAHSKQLSIFFPLFVPPISTFQPCAPTRGLPHRATNLTSWLDIARAEAML